MRDIAFSLAHSIASRAVLLVINMVAVKLLTTEHYGGFSYFLGIASSLATLSTFGGGVSANTVVARYHEKDPDFARRIVYANLIVVSVLTLISALVFLPFLNPPAQAGTSISGMITVAILFMVWITGSSSVLEGAMNGFGAFKRMSYHSIGLFVVSVPLAIILLWRYGLWGGLITVILHRCALTLANGFALWQADLLRFNYTVKTVFEKTVVGSLAGVSLPSALGAAMVGPVIALSMRMVAGQPEGYENLAYFSWVYTLYGIGTFIPSILGGYFISRLSKVSDGRKHLLRIMKFNAIIAFLVVSVMMVTKAEYLSYAGPDYLSNSSVVFNYLAAAVFLYSLNSAFASYWPTCGMAWVGFLINLVWASFLYGVTYTQVESLGAEALALAFFTSYIVLFVIQCLLVFLIPEKRI